MATINSTVRDANGKTIDDYKAAYAAAKAAGDAAGMQAANDAANAIRAGQGVAPEDAGVSIANTAAKAASSGGYTPLNATSAEMINYDNYLAQVRAQNAYIAANPSAVTYLPLEERQVDTSDAGTHGWTTTSSEELLQAMRQGYKTRSDTDENGQKVYYISDLARTEQEGSSGADEALLNDRDYAYVQYLKSDYAENQQLYNQALAQGNTALAAQYKAKMDQDHLEAERIRAGYNYSGGADGSMYIDYTMQAHAGNMPAYTSMAQNLLDAKGLSYTLPGGGTASSGGTAGGSGGFVPGVGDLTGRVEDYSAYLQQMYAAKQAAAIAELQAAYESNLAALDRAEDGVAADYQAARNQTAGASELARRNFAQYAAANGLNSGAGGQAELARNVALQNNLNTINTAEADTVADLELARANAEVEYNTAIAQAQATGDYELAAALYEEKVRVQEALIELQIQQQEYALKQYQLQYQAQQNTVENQLARDKLTFQQQQYADELTRNREENLAAYGEAYLKLGILPSAEMLAAMGMTEADAQAYIAALQK